MALSIWLGRTLCAAGAVLAGAFPLLAQYDKLAALGSDAAITPKGGPASSPPVATSPYDFPDLRPMGMLNDRLPGWLKFGVEERFRFEAPAKMSFNAGERDSYCLNRLRAGVVIRPAKWFSVIAQVQDARPFGQKPPVGPPTENRWDLKLGYAQLGNPDSGIISVRVGRQVLDYNSTLIAGSEWRNQGRSYDAAAVDLHVDRFRLGIFAASVVNALDQGFSHHLQGNNIYGLYSGIDRVLPGSAIEPFVLWRVAPSVSVENSGGRTGRLNEEAYGFRIRGKELSNFDYRFELVKEGGSAGSNPIRAWGTTLGVGYRRAAMRWRPRIFAGYDYASGDKNLRDGIRQTFDTMYPTAHDRFGITDQFGWQNIMAGRAGVTLEPHRRWSITGQHLNLWLASASDAVYNGSGAAIARDASGKSGTHIGEEFDVYAWYEVNREIHIGAGLGHLMPGGFLAKVHKGAAYTYPYIMLQLLDGKRVK